MNFTPGVHAFKSQCVVVNIRVFTCCYVSSNYCSKDFTVQISLLVTLGCSKNFAHDKSAMLQFNCPHRTYNTTIN